MLVSLGRLGSVQNSAHGPRGPRILNASYVRGSKSRTGPPGDRRLGARQDRRGKLSLPASHRRHGPEVVLLTCSCLSDSEAFPALGARPRTGPTRLRLTRKPDGHWGGQQRQPQPRSSTHTVNSGHSAHRRRRGPAGRVRQANLLVEVTGPRCLGTRKVCSSSGPHGAARTSRQGSL